MCSYVKALYDFKGEPGSTEISICAGDVLTVTRTDVGEGWWEGKNSKGETGLFPAAYVEAMSITEVQQMHAQTQNADNGNLTNTYRYDPTADELNDGDDSEDEWDDDNDTYSEIGPSPGGAHAGHGATAMLPYNYDKNLPAAPQDDSTSLASSAVAGASTTTLKKSGMFTKTSDTYILGIGNKEKLSEKEKSYVVQQDKYYAWKASHQPYSVVVASPKKESKFKGIKTFIAYHVTPSFNNVSVSRRYKRFDWLHERLEEKFCLIPIPPLPDKQISGRYEEQFVEHRRVQLQEFVDWVCRHPILSNCEVWYHFLTCTDESMWKIGKRRAEKDQYVGVTYCWAITPPEKQLLPSFVDSQMDGFSQFIHSMDTSVKNLLAIANDTCKRYQTQCKKDFQRIGDGFSDLAKSLNIDERRCPPKSGVQLSSVFGRIGGIFISIGQLYADQPKFDWIPLSDRLHIYRGILNNFPDILSTHKGAMQKRKECERLVAEQKMGNQQLADVNRRTDVISYAVMAEMTHFGTERDTHLKQTMKCLIEAQIKFYSNIVAKLQEAYQQFD